MQEKSTTPIREFLRFSKASQEQKIALLEREALLWGKLNKTIAENTQQSYRVYTVSGLINEKIVPTLDWQPFIHEIEKTDDDSFRQWIGALLKCRHSLEDRLDYIISSGEFGKVEIFKHVMATWHFPDHQPSQLLAPLQRLEQRRLRQKGVPQSLDFRLTKMAHVYSFDKNPHVKLSPSSEIYISDQRMALQKATFADVVGDDGVENILRESERQPLDTIEANLVKSDIPTRKKDTEDPRTFESEEVVFASYISTSANS